MNNNILLPNVLSPTYWKHMGQDVRLIYSLLRDERVPLYLKVLPVLVALYLLSPFDLIPGFLPVLGQMDDFGLMLLTLKAFTRLVPPAIVEEYLAQPT